MENNAPPNTPFSISDLAFGRDSTLGQRLLAYLAGLALTIFTLVQVVFGYQNWPEWKYLLAIVLTFDLGAGLVANATDSCRRFYHSPPAPGEPALVRLLKHPMLFAALHIHPIIIGLVYDDQNWAYALFGYGFFLLACWIVVRAPTHLKRPWAYFFLFLAILGGDSGPLYFNWLLPVLYLKIIAGRLLNDQTAHISSQTGQPLTASHPSHPIPSQSSLLEQVKTMFKRPLFSSNLWRIAFIALGLLVVILIIVLASRFSTQRIAAVAATPVPVKTLAPESLYLGDFSAVQGTAYQYAMVSERYEESWGSSVFYGSARYGSGSESFAHNVVFLNRDTLETHRLYPTNKFVILGVSQFPTPISNTEDKKPIVPVRAVVYQTVVRDTNNDGVLNRDDSYTIAISEPGGSGYNELVSDVSELYWIAMTSQNSLVIIYQQNSVKKTSQVDINQRVVLTTKTLVDLGPEVK